MNDYTKEFENKDTPREEQVAGITPHTLDAAAQTPSDAQQATPAAPSTTVSEASAPTAGESTAYTATDGPAHTTAAEAVQGAPTLGQTGYAYQAGGTGSTAGQGAPTGGAGTYQQPGYTTQSGSGYYGSYYNGPYYGSQAQQGSLPGAGAVQPSWVGTSPAATTATAVKTRKGPSRILGYIAFLLVAALCGFGGGYLANANSQSPGSTVVYRSAEGMTASRTGSVEGLSVSDVAEAASESVVSITTENVVTNPFTGGQIQSGAGSGVIISENGYIVTNNHVIAGADNIIVTLPDGSEIDATLVGTDPTSDIAVLKADITGLTPAILGDSDALAVGDMCLAIGNPMGTLGGTVTDGIISAMNREITIDDTSMNLLQMSAAVSPGNSGGGLFNANAELIGIVNAKSSGESTEGLGFAIPINTAMQVAQDLIDHGYVTGRPALGVVVEEIASAEQALQRGVGTLGVYVLEVTEGGAADVGGLQPGDMLVSFDGSDISTTGDLTRAIQNVEVGSEIEVVVNRGGERLDLTITMQERAAS